MISFVSFINFFKVNCLLLLQARYRSDREVNNRRTEVLVDKKLVNKYWKEVKVGDIIYINNNDFIPVILLLIYLFH